MYFQLIICLFYNNINTWEFGDHMLLRGRYFSTVTLIPYNSPHVTIDTTGQAKPFPAAGAHVITAKDMGPTTCMLATSAPPRPYKSPHRSPLYSL